MPPAGIEALCRRRARGPGSRSTPSIGAQYLEVLPEGVSKGAALGCLVAAVGPAGRRSIAIGDNWNNLEMIEAAGLGVAMGHAPGVRARADHVWARADEEGVRQVIERFLLQEPLDPVRGLTYHRASRRTVGRNEFATFPTKEVADEGDGSLSMVGWLVALALGWAAGAARPR